MAHEYTDEQIDVLVGAVPDIMATLAQIRERGSEALSPVTDTDPYLTIGRMCALAMKLFANLDRYCWHTPPCETGEVCLGGEPRRLP